MALKARITMSGDDCTSGAFTLPAKATKLNRHGAAIQLNRELFDWFEHATCYKTLATFNSRPVVTRLAHNVGSYVWSRASRSRGCRKKFWGITFPPLAR